MSKLGWIDSFKPLVVPSFFGGGAFYIFLLRQFFSTIPFELDDAAKVDGCSNLRIYSRILMPLSTSALGIVALFTFVAVYQDFMTPIIYLTSVDKFTLPIGLFYFKAVATAGTFGMISQTGSYYNFLMAASLVIMLPPILLFFFTQRSFMQGVVITGLKS
jgi:multiple sugar transport system permease protein